MVLEWWNRKSEGLWLQKGMPWDTNNVRFQRGTVHQKEASGQSGDISSVTGSWRWPECHLAKPKKQPEVRNYTKMLKRDWSTKQKSKERWNCFHMAICVDRSLKIFRQKQKTRGTKPGLSAMPYHGDGDECPLPCNMEMSSMAIKTYWIVDYQTLSLLSLNCKTKEKGEVKKREGAKKGWWGWGHGDDWEEKSSNESKLLRFNHIYAILGIFSGKLSNFKHSNIFQESILALARQWL